MRNYLLTLLLLASQAHAGGAVVAGGKTNTAILVYEQDLSWDQRKEVYAEIQKQFDLGNLSHYESVTDPNGKLGMCAQFKLLMTYKDAVVALKFLAEGAGIPEAVQPVGSCQFNSVN